MPIRQWVASDLRRVGNHPHRPLGNAVAVRRQVLAVQEEEQAVVIGLIACRISFKSGEVNILGNL